MDSNKKKKLLQIFSELYKNPKSELKFKNQYQLLISVMLSAQSTDKKVNEVTPELFRQFPHFRDLKDARRNDIETLIREVNYHKTKARHLIATAQRVCESYSGRVPRTHEELTSLPGVGNKTANVVLSELKIKPAFPVDTHVFRVSRRLGLARASSRDKVEVELREAFDPSVWRNLHHWLIFHGRRVCKAQRPLCDQCALAGMCPSAESQ